MLYPEFPEELLGQSPEPAVHRLKLHREFYSASESGNKTFEIRRDDRHFRVGDILELAEYDPQKREYTGRKHWKEITYILDDETFLAPGYVCLGVVPVFEDEQKRPETIDTRKVREALNEAYRQFPYGVEDDSSTFDSYNEGWCDALEEINGKVCPGEDFLIDVYKDIHFLK